jgi:F-type H+-transporting ATPase subunit b
MNLEWGQIVTHIIGFLIVVWLLRKYAWSKLLGLMEERRQKIETSFTEIDTAKAEVEAQRLTYEKELANIEELRREKIQKAAQEANKLASEIRDEARRDTTKLRDKAKEDIERDVDKANAALRDQMVDAVITTTEKVIRERLDRDKHSKLIEDLLNEVKVK